MEQNKPSIQELIDQALEPKEGRLRSGKFSPSSLGKCYRAQIYNRKNEPQTNPPDTRTRRVFKVGELFHRFIEDLLITSHPEAQKEVLVETDDFKGYADLVINGEVIDIKSQHSKAFWYRSGLEWRDLEPKLRPNILQVVFYAVELGKERARLVMVSKDDLCINEYPFSVAKWKAELGVEIATLRDFWGYDALPPAEPRAYPDGEGNAKECAYCPWRDKCQAMELAKPAAEPQK